MTPEEIGGILALEGPFEAFTEGYLTPEAVEDDQLYDLLDRCATYAKEFNTSYDDLVRVLDHLGVDTSDFA